MHIFTTLILFLAPFGIFRYFSRRKIRDYFYTLPVEQIPVRVLDKSVQPPEHMPPYWMYDLQGYSHSISFDDLSGSRFVGKAQREFFAAVEPGDAGILSYKTWHGQVMCCAFQRERTGNSL